jgi:hypothetical protein
LSTLSPPQISVSTFNHSILSIGSSSSSEHVIRQLSPCSEDDDDDDVEKPIGLESNLWDSPISQTAGEGRITIKTKYDSSLPENQHLICPVKEQRQERFDFTLRERRRAEKAKVPVTVEEMENMVSFFKLSALLK